MQQQQQQQQRRQQDRVELSRCDKSASSSASLSQLLLDNQHMNHNKQTTAVLRHNFFLLKISCYNIYIYYTY